LAGFANELIKGIRHDQLDFGFRHDFYGGGSVLQIVPFKLKRTAPLLFSNQKIAVPLQGRMFAVLAECNAPGFSRTLKRQGMNPRLIA
jgi:hypothetical protein